MKSSSEEAKEFIKDLNNEEIICYIFSHLKYSEKRISEERHIPLDDVFLCLNSLKDKKENEVWIELIMRLFSK